MTRNPTSITAKDPESPEYLENLYQLVAYGQIHLSVAVFGELLKYPRNEL